MTRVFIDGSAGTTGLRIIDRLSEDKSLDLIVLEGDARKDVSARKEAVNSCDVAFLCLPDDAARESVSFVENASVVVIDTSTAHRTAEGWTYGFPEIKGQREKIRTSKRIANPGCHASGFISLIRPLTDAGIVKKDRFLSCTSVTGYSGGGKKMIADYEDPDRKEYLSSPRLYGLSQEHKHLKEMAKLSGLAVFPAFLPIVAPFYSGMTVSVALDLRDTGHTKKNIIGVFEEYYWREKFVRFIGDVSENGFLSSAGMSGYDSMEIFVYGNDERVLLVSRFDNLGKGASGAAIQNMNICLGREETAGLCV
ncbi:MAG: N-acetyl-gamma-glutamyl-phosphate reductase [Clostridia bacterium]|nr:N-acetyl-gamma-glutamyl-phosphate reductase [Clostridia bacterium]